MGECRPRDPRVVISRRTIIQGLGALLPATFAGRLLTGARSAHDGVQEPEGAEAPSCPWCTGRLEKDSLHAFLWHCDTCRRAFDDPDFYDALLEMRSRPIFREGSPQA